MDLAIPPAVQLLASVFFGLIVAGTVAYKFFLDIKRPSAPSRSDYSLIGAALGDTQAIGEVVDQLRAIREIMTRQHDRSDAIVRGLDEIAEAVRSTRGQPRRPPTKREPR